MTDAKEYSEKEMEAYNRRALELLALARIYVERKGPYFMRMVRTLVPVPMPGLGTVGVSDTMLFVYDPIRLVDDPEFSALTDGLPTKLAGALVHECEHVIRGMYRLQELAKIDKVLANIAGDLAINADLRAAGWDLPTWACYPEKFNLPEGKVLEWYFAELLKDPEDSKCKSSGEVAGGGCGGVAGNSTVAEERAKEMFADKQRSGAQVDNAIRATVADTERYFASKPGNAPSWVKEAGKGLKERRTKRNWRKLLGHVIRRTTGIVKSGGADYSMSRPSRRSLIFPEIVKPGMVEQEVEVCTYWDTSASVGRKELEEARQITVEVLRQLGVDSVLLAQGDTTVQMDVKRTRLKDISTIDRHGKGGTDFRPIFEMLSKMRPKPDVLIIYTDGDGPAPVRPPPRTPVVWVILPTAWSRRPTKWGHYVVCSDDHDVVDAHALA